MTIIKQELCRIRERGEVGMAGADRDIVDGIIYIVPTESDIIDGEICIVDTGVCFWEDDYDKKLEYYEASSTENLIAILEKQSDFEEFDAVLHALYERKPKIAVKLAKAILESDEDYAWTIASVLRFVGLRDNRYALDYLRKNIDTMEYPVLDDALLCVNYRTIDKDLLPKITKRYNSFTKQEREHVSSYRVLMEILNEQKYKRQLRKFARKNRLRDILR